MKSMKVLLLQDNPFLCSVIKTSLASLGIVDVIEASMGREALSLLRSKGAVDFAICDLKLLGTDSLMFFGCAAKEGFLKSVMISGDADSVLRQTASALLKTLGLKCLGGLGRPYSSEKIRALITGIGFGEVSLFNVGVKPELPGITEVRRALLDCEFSPYFQPKFDIQTGRVVGAEALARWINPRQGVMAPAAFLPVIESCGLIDELFRAIFSQGLLLQKKMRQQGAIALPLAFNLHASQLSRRNLINDIAGLLAFYELPASGVTFELTETGALGNDSVALETLLRLRLMGCGLSMDDFGSGYSSMGRLCELPFTEIKLDARFLRDGDSQSRSLEVIRASVSMAKAMNVTLVVEGVESAEHMTLLRSIGCQFAQGYYLGKPMAAESVVSWLPLRAGGA
ncbi:EAL domain-containing response regulator [Pseudomonas sp. NPDC089569]|uniref:EAL domain-containing response regulator n=1 Tax=Pseudomonas sp. NPDC089569 TaxID=3390722 RepID=UPI003D06A8A2